MPSFYFEQVLQMALNGIDQNVTGPVLQLASVILILSLLYAVYEAYSNGGDVRALGVAGIKYLILGLVFLNYQQAFRSVNGMFNSVADFIYNTNGIGDVIQNLLNSVSTYISQQGLSSFWTLVTGAISGLLDVLLILVGLIILPVSYTLFTLAYAMYGSILYLVGPFVLALWPSRAMGQLARTYFVNLMIFQSWGLLYAILQVLITALQMNSLNAVLGGNGVLNVCWIEPNGPVGSGQRTVLYRNRVDSISCQSSGARRRREHCFCLSCCRKSNCQNGIGFEHVLTSLPCRSSPSHVRTRPTHRRWVGFSRNAFGWRQCARTWRSARSIETADDVEPRYGSQYSKFRRRNRSDWSRRCRLRMRRQAL